MRKTEIVKLLNQDIEGEHAAIIQYLIHAYAMGEGELACEIEAIAREEMRHLDWLATQVVELGGTPSFTRGDMRLKGKTVSAWMKNDVLAENDAIALYKDHISQIDNPRIKRLLERILSDEQSHHGDFKHFVQKVTKEGMTDIRGTKSNNVTKILNWGIEHEYTVVLQYLLHSYLAPDCDMQKEMRTQAINEMQHLGWLAEELISEGGNPKIEHTSIEHPKKPADMLTADIKIEKIVAAKYDAAAKKLTDPKLKKLLNRIRDHELYHVKVFNDLKKNI